MASNTPQAPSNDPNAADLIRDKLMRIYNEAQEPNARTEMAEAQQAPYRSKHQQFMYELSTSGKDLATVQTEWHNYYQNLSPEEKHQVWQEFYSSQSMLTGHQPAKNDMAQAMAEHKHQAARSLKKSHSKKGVKETIKHKVSAGGKLEAKHHIQSLLFGLGMGTLVLLILLFGFFNEVFIAPFIQPGRTTANTPLIIGNENISATAEPKIIIPKINVEIPVDYTQTSSEESVIESALENGVVHYPTTTKPGETGNTAIFGHSSNNIFNRGKYKFAFVMLRTLTEGDTFYLTYNGKLYVYKVISHQVVEPSNVSVLNPVSGQTATATLITCDPPGTSLKRLVVVGQQISPDPTGNTQAIASTSSASPPDNLPGNGPTLFGRVIRTTPGKMVGIALIILAFGATIRWVNQGAKPKTA